MLAAGLIAGIVSSVLFNLGIALQAIEARRTPRAEGLRASLIWDLLHRRLWVAGLGIEWLGVPLEILAFAWAPFVVVQPLLACGLLVLLAVARRLLGEMPSREGSRSGSRMTRLGKSELVYGELLTVEEILASIDAVTLHDTQALAAELLSGPLSLAVVGPYDDDRMFAA